MKFFSGVTNEYPTELYSDLLRYRYRVFVEKLGWDLQTRDGMESDQFDREDTVHVVARDGDGRISGCSRLLPTVKPYLLGEVFPQLMDEQSLPCCEDTWELSRFSAHNLHSEDAITRNFFFSPSAFKLLTYSIATAASFGARNFIFVGSNGMATLMERANFNIQRASPVTNIGGHRVLACWLKF